MRPFLLIISLLFSTYSVAAESSIAVKEVYARATPPNAPTSAIFLSMHNHGDQDISLVAAATPAAGRVELHTMLMDGDVMKMRQVKEIKVAANTMVELKPGGLHLMLFDLQIPFKEGEELQLTLKFSDGSQQQLLVPVKKVMHKMKHHH
ncbi:copper chaperone PCu(A)C [Agarivorans sp. 1_MG-2023]|uniref:copper chaperone PCu(A)C n=1 Tax=Agarivorans sp. 1_MG-2023 TaxID=3062634 RepID=UPI0026E19C15|nr:copper chaperone PCu(A)C [Agarivorans sp. 1_MG-2023]MDO6763651.1 copper chaperone PCu(A)C [Agarivorans sp. 1_MG-2023]